MFQVKTDLSMRARVGQEELLAQRPLSGSQTKTPSCFLTTWGPSGLCSTTEHVGTGLQQNDGLGPELAALGLASRNRDSLGFQRTRRPTIRKVRTAEPKTASKRPMQQGALKTSQSWLIQTASTPHARTTPCKGY